MALHKESRFSDTLPVPVLVPLDSLHPGHNTSAQVEVVSADMLVDKLRHVVRPTQHHRCVPSIRTNLSDLVAEFAVNF